MPTEEVPRQTLAEQYKTPANLDARIRLHERFSTNRGTNRDAHGFLTYGAAHVRAGRSDTMLPYGDYFFMEALMRALGHSAFFW